MTEREVKKRHKYRERRQRWITIHSIALILVVVAIFGVLFVHDELTKESFVEYAESSNVKYSVKIPKDAPFYSEYLEEFSEFADENGDLWIPCNYAYPTTAATVVKINIDYLLEVCAPDVDYIYTYRITAQPEVVDGATKNKFPLPKTILEEVDEPIKENSNTKLAITKSIEIDYHYYDDLVKKFENQMDIKDATENLIITMEVEVVGTSEILHSNSENTCVIKVTMPLNENAFDVNYSTTSSNCGDCKILAAHRSNEYLVRMLEAAMILAYVAIGLFVLLVVGILITRNNDINYYNKIRRLVNNYRSFIQRVEGGFDASGYQIVVISTFREMLAIRDTIQSPVLMSENTDKTRAQFFIPTNTRILYLYEVKVDNYDKLYREHPDWVDDSIINVGGASRASVANPAIGNNQGAPANVQYVPVANGQYAPHMNNQTPVASNSYANYANRYTSNYVDGQHRGMTSGNCCYPCRTIVNVTVNGCKVPTGESTVKVVSGNCQDENDKK